MSDRTRGIKAVVTGGVAVFLAAGVALGANSLFPSHPASQNVVLAGDQLTTEPTETPEASKTPEASETPEPSETPEAKDSEGQNESSGQHGDNGTKTPEPTETPDGGSSDGGQG